MPIKECKVDEVSQLHFAFFVVELYDSKVQPVWHIVISDAAPYISFFLSDKIISVPDSESKRYKYLDKMNLHY